MTESTTYLNFEQWTHSLHAVSLSLSLSCPPRAGVCSEVSKRQFFPTTVTKLLMGECWVYTTHGQNMAWGPELAVDHLDPARNILGEN